MVLPPDATYDEFRDYTRDLRGDVSEDEMQDLWVWRQKLLTVDFGTGRGQRSQLPPDEQHLTVREQATKQIAEAKSQGREPIYMGRRWV